jgi:hypothetical protein
MCQASAVTLSSGRFFSSELEKVWCGFLKKINRYFVARDTCSMSLRGLPGKPAAQETSQYVALRIFKQGLLERLGCNFLLKTL